MSEEKLPFDRSIFVEINGKMERLMDGINSVKEKQDEMTDHIAKIKEAVYNPDEGLYARIRSLEQWKDSSLKIQWVVITSLVGLLVVQFWNIVMGQ